MKHEQLMLDLQDLQKSSTSNLLQTVAASIFGIILLSFIVWLIFSVDIGVTALRPVAHQGTAAAIGKMLFGPYVLPFELTSFLILAAVLSVVVLARKEIPR